jgi:hypothetical protein
VLQKAGGEIGIKSMPIINLSITTKLSKKALAPVPCSPCTLFRRRLHMGASVVTFFGVFVAIFFGLFVAIFLPLIMSGKRWKAEQDRARARRMTEHRMNARLLRLNI